MRRNMAIIFICHSFNAMNLHLNQISRRKSAIEWANKAWSRIVYKFVSLMSTCEKCFRALIPLGTNQGKVEKLELFLVRFVHFFLGGGEVQTSTQWLWHLLMFESTSNQPLVRLNQGDQIWLNLSTLANFWGIILD